MARSLAVNWGDGKPHGGGTLLRDNGDIFAALTDAKCHPRWAVLRSLTVGGQNVLAIMVHLPPAPGP